MILPRYLTRQFTPPFLFGLALFSGVLLLDKLFDLVDLLVNKGVSPWLSAKMFGLFIPTALTLSLPMSALLACLLAFGRLSEDQEVTAMRASGLSFFQILWPPLAGALGLSVLLVPFNTALAPRAMGAFRDLYHDIVGQDPLLQVEPKKFAQLPGARLYAEEVGADNKTMKNVWIYQPHPDGSRRTYARAGAAEVSAGGFRLRLEDGQMERHSRLRPGDLLHVRFRRYEMRLPLTNGKGGRGRGLRELSLRDLRLAEEERRKNSLPSGEVEAEIQLRFALAFAPFTLAALGVPLGLTLERGGRGVGFGAAVGVLFVYYLLLIMGLNLAEKGALPAVPALWTANAFTLGAAAWLTARRTRR